VWAGSLIWIITPGSEYLPRIAGLGGGDLKKTLPEPPVTLGFHKEPVKRQSLYIQADWRTGFTYQSGVFDF